MGREMDADPMFKMDHTNRIKEKTQRENQRLRELLELQEDRSDAYAANCALRAAHRKRRKEERAEEEKRIKAGPLNFALPLLPPTEHDAREAKMVCFRTDHQKIERAVKRSSINATSLFKRPSCDQSDGCLPQLVAKRRRLEQAARMARLFDTGGDSDDTLLKLHTDALFGEDGARGSADNTMLSRIHVGQALKTSTSKSSRGTRQSADRVTSNHLFMGRNAVKVIRVAGARVFLASRPPSSTCGLLSSCDSAP